MIHFFPLFGSLQVHDLRDELGSSWIIRRTEDQVSLVMLGDDLQTVSRGIFIKSNGEVNIFVHGHPLKNNHQLMYSIASKEESEAAMMEESQGKLLFGKMDLQEAKCLAENVESMKVCEGCWKYEELWNEGVFKKRGTIETQYYPFPVYRSISCSLLLPKVEKNVVCLACRSEQSNMSRKKNRRSKWAIEQQKQEHKFSSKNIRYMPRHELEAALREARSSDSKHRQQIRHLKKRIDKMINREGEDMSKGWSSEFKNINRKNFEKMTPIQKLFWDQQMKRASLKNKASMRWHPMMIRLALQFQKAAKKVTEAGFISLPSSRTLFDYSHCIEPKEGCQIEVLKDLKRELELKCSEDHERYVDLMFDEMHIRSNLVYQKSTGELVGYAKLDEIEQEFQNLQAEWTGKESQPQLAHKVLVFMIKNITVNKPENIVRGIVAVYSVPASMSASSLFTRLWEVIYHLENSGIPVLCVTCDGASTNRTCINMHPRYKSSAFIEFEGIDEDDESNLFDEYGGENDVLFSTINIASPHLRQLFFFIDMPHVLKTIRNAFANSYCHKKSRRLWNGEDLSWQLIVDHYEKHKNDKLRKSMITAAHVYLTSFSVMRVSYAAQVMSKRLSSAIHDAGEEAEMKGEKHLPFRVATNFMRMTNDFFDCLNGHNVTSHKRYRNDNLKPYSSGNDTRFGFMKNYLIYLQEWKANVRSRSGHFSKKQRQAMMLPEQTLSAVRINIFSLQSCVRFLVNAGAKEICPRRFSQDPLEHTFGIFRQDCGASNNPDLAQLLSSRASHHARRQTVIPSSRGNVSVEKEELPIDPTPVPKRKKK